MNKLFICFSIVVALLLSACRNPAIKNVAVSAGDSILEDSLARMDSTLFFLDSFQIFNFLERNPQIDGSPKNLESFYIKRNGAFAWINNSGINEYGRNFMNLLNNEKVKSPSDSLFSVDKLHGLYNELSEESYHFKRKDSLITELELLLTSSFFDYAKRNWKGISDDELKGVGWFMERKNLNYEDLLDTILKNDAKNMASVEPVYRQYSLLKKYLKLYNDIENKGGWPEWQRAVKSMKTGDTSLAIAAIRKQLFMLGDLPVFDSLGIFDDKMEAAVKKFQKRHGIKEDGIISGITMQEMHVPVHDRIQQIMINMERSRWLPVEQQGDYLAVNIPDFKLLVYHDDTLLWSCNVVVGKTKTTNNTVIFNDNLEYIVFWPYWNIPKSILIKETLPEIKKNSNYLVNHNMEIITYEGTPVASSSIEWSQYTTSFPYIIRQKPGKNNALGLLKFLFPNSYDIYMHDTPEKSLFDESTRTFSHGCIRLEKPLELAEFLLRADTSWTKNKIQDLLNSQEQKFVKLKNKVPVFITYFTAWVDRKGQLNFRQDVYHHDAKMKALLFTEK